MKNNMRPIGIFDSGFGGLSVWLKVHKLMPFESIVYRADNANCPYGPKSVEEVIRLSCENTERLLDQGAKIIVLACNTATAAAIDYLRNHYEVPFIGMEPAIKPASIHTKTGKVGILATEGTIKGRLFNETKSKFAAHIETYVRIGHGLVELVEKNRQNSLEAEALLRTYLEPMLEKGVDQLVLGCTHYPFLSDTIRKITGDQMQLIDPAGAVARRTYSVLQENGLLNEQEQTGQYEFETSGDPVLLEQFLQTIGIRQQVENML